MNAALLAAARREGLPRGGLVALYDFVQGADPQVLYDRSGNGKHATLGSTAAADANDPQWGAQGLVYDGVDDRVLGPVLPEVSASGLTYLVVINSTRASIPQSILDNKFSGTNNMGMSLETTSDGQALMRVANGTVQFQITGRRVVDGTPRLLVGVADRARSAAQLYLGAELQGQYPLNPAWDFTSLRPLYLGSYGAGGYLLGTIYYAAIYTRALTDAEIARAYRSIRRTLQQRGVQI